MIAGAPAAHSRCVISDLLPIVSGADGEAPEHVLYHGEPGDAAGLVRQAPGAAGADALSNSQTEG